MPSPKSTSPRAKSKAAQAHVPWEAGHETSSCLQCNAERAFTRAAAKILRVRTADPDLLKHLCSEIDPSIASLLSPDVENSFPRMLETFVIAHQFMVERFVLSSSQLPVPVFVAQSTVALEVMRQAIDAMVSPTPDKTARVQHMRDLARGAKKPGERFNAAIANLIVTLRAALPKTPRRSWGDDDWDLIARAHRDLEALLGTPDLSILLEGLSGAEAELCIQEVLHQYGQSIKTPAGILAELTLRALKRDVRGIGSWSSKTTKLAIRRNYDMVDKRYNEQPRPRSTTRVDPSPTPRTVGVKRMH